YEFDPALYEPYAVERQQAGGIDTVPFVVPDRLNSVVGVITRFATPPFSRFSASLSVVPSRDVSFFEPSAVRYLSINGTLQWRPTPALRVDGSYRRLQTIPVRCGS